MELPAEHVGNHLLATPDWGLHCHEPEHEANTSELLQHVLKFIVSPATS